MSYVAPSTLTPGMTVKASHWNNLVNNLIDMNDRITALEAGTAGTADYSSFPLLAIVAYSGGSATLPSGWYVCNGGTVGGTVLPDLRSKFIYGASVDGDLAATGGGTAHTHTNEGTGSDGSHKHTASGRTGSAVGGAYVEGGSTTTHVASTGHTHTFDFNTNEAGSHSHGVGDTGSASNLPPYVKLYYITRIG